MNRYGTEIDQSLEVFRGQFADDLPLRIQEINHLIRVACNGHGNEVTLSTLRRLVQNLAGAASAYGYLRIARLAEQLGRVLERNLETANTLPLDSLRELAANLQKSTEPPSMRAVPGNRTARRQAINLYTPPLFLRELQQALDRLNCNPEAHGLLLCIRLSASKLSITWPGVLRHLANQSCVASAVMRLGQDTVALLFQGQAAVAIDTATAMREGLDGLIPGFATGDLALGILSLRGTLTAHEAMRRCQLALNRAVLRGAHRLQRYALALEPHAAPIPRHGWESRLREALRDDQLRLAFQPIICAPDIDTPRYELLVRLHAQGEDIPAAAFMEAAEHLRLAVHIDRWVVGRALTLLREQAVRGRPLQLFVNLSRDTVENGRMHSWLRDRIVKQGLAPGTLVFELAQTTVEAVPTKSAALAGQLHAAGTEIALDRLVYWDSFDQAELLKADYLKLDGSLIRDLRQNPAAQQRIRTIADYAHRAASRVVATCVEDALTVPLLSRLGVRNVQGHFTRSSNADFVVDFGSALA